MNKKKYFDTNSKDKKYKTLFNFFPLKFYEKFKKSIISFFVFFLLITIIYLIVAAYLNNVVVWSCLTIPIAFLIFGSLILTQINVNICIKKFKQKIYLHQKELSEKNDLFIIIDKKKLFKKRSNFIEELIKQVSEQIN